MDPERKKFLNRRLRDASKEQPALLRLRSLLLRFGGEFLVAPPKPDGDVGEILESGFLFEGEILFRPMKRSSCHQNVASMWKMRRHGVVGIATGYALSEDGLWRQHSWGVRRDGVLETTEARVKYFGILLQGERADQFTNSNLQEPVGD